jgi:histone H2B
MSEQEKSAGIKKKGKRGGVPKMHWATYLHKVKGQVHPDLGMASDAMFVVNGIVEDFKERLINESFAQALIVKSGTLKAKHGRSAASILLDGGLLKHTMAEGHKACEKYAINA